MMIRIVLRVWVYSSEPIGGYVLWIPESGIL